MTTLNDSSTATTQPPRSRLLAAANDRELDRFQSPKKRGGKLWGHGFSRRSSPLSVVASSVWWHSVRSGCSLLCLIGFAWASVIVAQPTKKAPSPAAITVKAYADSVAGINDCATFRSAVAKLPDAAPLLSGLVTGQGEGEIRKGEFETTEQYETRIRALLTAKLGDPDRLVIRVPIEEYKVKYNADTQTATVEYVVDWIGDGQLLKFASRVTGERTYMAANAFGERVEVTSTRRTEDSLFLQKKQLYTPRGGNVATTIDVKLPVDQAKFFKGHASIVLLVRLIPPFVESKRQFLEATLDDPYELTTQSNKFHVEGQCAVLRSGTDPIADIEVAIDKPPPPITRARYRLPRMGTHSSP